MSPIIPDSTSKILDTLQIEKKSRTIESLNDFKFLKPGSNVKETNILFKKIENDN